MTTPRVRFAPSPTGYLHVGGARTALFNWLFARRSGGVFVLRIEDTDLERSSQDMVTGILDGLRWLGLTWDEGPDVGGLHAPYFQSERLDSYRTAADRLLSEGHAYYCYCTPERLRDERERAEARGEAWQYDRTCLGLSADRIRELDAAGTPRALRFNVPSSGAAFDDAVHGRIAFEGASIEDFVILRSDRYPTYHLSVVVDDIDMGITDVIRGDDHISNTPKHLLLFQALGAAVPRFAHVPLILGADKKRLSKRHGATSVMEYQRQGYLAPAMVNFLALLGWSPGGDREILSRDELISLFTLEGISGGNAVFNPEKLDWFNQQHIGRLTGAALLARLEPRLREAGLWRESFTGAEGAWIVAVLDLLKPRVKKLDQLVDELRPFLVEEPEFDQGAAGKHLTAAIQPVLARFADAVERQKPADPAAVEQLLRGTAEQAGVKAAALIHGTRVAVTGRAVSAGLFEVLSLLGVERTVQRLRRAVSYPPTP